MSVHRRTDGLADALFGREVVRAASRVLALALFLSVVAPLGYLLLVALSPAQHLAGTGLIPSRLTLASFAGAIERIGPYVLNSFLIAVGTSLLTLTIAVPGAYVFGRVEFPYKRGVFVLVLLSFLFPDLIIVVPIANVWYDVGLYNTLLGLWVVNAIRLVPWTIWILRDFFADLPDRLEEAARVYGCTTAGAIVRVIVPLAIPAVVAAGFLAFIAGWNEFLYANVLTNDAGPRPAVVQLFVTVVSTEGIDWSLLLAQAFVVGTPPAVLYLFVRRHLTRALAPSN